jgi:hypothetical protein
MNTNHQKNLFALVIAVFASWSALAQESSFTIGGGWSSISPEYFSSSASGYRIIGLYEFNPGQGKIAHGLNVGYVRTTASGSSSGPAGVISGTVNVTLQSIPVYYAPKIYFGNSEKIRFFLKGALGWQFGSYKTEGASATIEVNDRGFYGGLGAGGALNLNEKLFLNVEYEWAYAANMYYGNGYLNSVQLGMGFRF